MLSQPKVLGTFSQGSRRLLRPSCWVCGCTRRYNGTYQPLQELGEEEAQVIKATRSRGEHGTDGRRRSATRDRRHNVRRDKRHTRTASESLKLSPIERIRAALLPSSLEPTLPLGREGAKLSTRWKVFKDVLDSDASSPDELLQQTRHMIFHKHNYPDQLSQGVDLVLRAILDAGIDPLEDSIKKPKRSIGQAREALKLLNAYEARTRYMGAWSDGELVAHGLLLAVKAKSIPALHYYIALAQSAWGSRTLPHQYERMLGFIQYWIQTDAFHGWEGLRRKVGLNVLLTGPKADQFPFLDRMQLRHLRPYLRSLEVVSEPQAIHRAWDQFRMTETFSRHIKPSKSRRQSNEMAEIVHCFIKALVGSGGPALAWQVAKSMKWKPDQFMDETWSVLLDYPEYITEWDESMREPVLQKYEHIVRDIEDTLGVRWTGGEDGEHIFIDDEGDVESIQESFLVDRDSADRS